MSRANADLMDLLHSLVATSLKDELLAAKERSKDRYINGELVPGEPINPQLIDKALKFLKDNGINAPATSPRVDSLAKELLDLDLEEEAVNLRID